jgi:hypothetical protein
VWIDAQGCLLCQLPGPRWAGLSPSHAVAPCPWPPQKYADLADVEKKRYEAAMAACVPGSPRQRGVLSWLGWGSGESTTPSRALTPAPLPPPPTGTRSRADVPRAAGVLCARRQRPPGQRRLLSQPHAHPRTTKRNAGRDGKGNRQHLFSSLSIRAEDRRLCQSNHTLTEHPVSLVSVAPRRCVVSRMCGRVRAPRRTHPPWGSFKPPTHATLAFPPRHTRRRSQHKAAGVLNDLLQCLQELGRLVSVHVAVVRRQVDRHDCAHS